MTVIYIFCLISPPLSSCIVSARQHTCLSKNIALLEEQRLVNLQPIMSLNIRLELENEILDLEQRLENARSRLRGARENPARDDSNFADSMLSMCTKIFQE